MAIFFHSWIFSKGGTVLSNKLWQLSEKMREEREELCTRGMRVSEFRQNLTVSLYKTITTPPGHDFEAREPSQHGHALLCWHTLR